MKKHFKVLSLLLFIFCAALSALGQETVGSIEITTKDAAGAVVPGVAVTIISSGGTAGFRRTATTDDSGLVRIPQVPPGTYNVTAAATSGFAETTAPAVVELGKTAQVFIQLGVKANTVTVTVTV